jgi:hypothetical protein
LEKYGVEYPMQSEELKKKARATNLEKYGVEYALQNPEVYEEASTYKKKEIPSGNTITLQGYASL